MRKLLQEQLLGMQRQLGHDNGKNSSPNIDLIFLIIMEIFWKQFFAGTLYKAIDRNCSGI